ncbi:MAG: PD40 domain-containing protein, partial [Candidatus Cloacimonetes bacterium]|nr:PD40 domain-containing protein [Candidatus Cloacimonadota bacterium]
MTGFLPSPRHRSIAILLTAAVLAGCAGKSDTPGRVKKAEKTPSAGSAAQNVSGTARQLTFSAGDQASPAFFPDGKSLIFQNNSDGNWELYTLDLAGGDPRRLTDSPENEENP